MAWQHDRAAFDVVRQSSQPRRGSLFELKHLSHTTDMTTDSNSIYSDEKEIYNAVAVSSSGRNSRAQEPSYQMGPILEEGLAANLAMFIPPSSSSSSPPLTALHARNKKGHQRSYDVRCRTQALSDQSSNRLKQGLSSGLSETKSAVEITQIHCKTCSLDAMKTGGRSSNWPGNPGPAVLPNQPRYSPPNRIPTPPGVPSFNTPEAVHCSAQFLTGHHGGRFYAPRNAGNAEQSSPSYGDTFRRLFGLPPSANAQPSSQSFVGIGRADDGTLVHGRLPYRQSGHNSIMARQIFDHPFHQTNLPIAEADDIYETEGADAKNTDGNVQPRGSTQGYGRSSRGGREPFHNGLESSTLEPHTTPQLAVSDRAHSFFGITRAYNRQNALDGVALSYPSHQSATTTGNHSPSHHSQLQSVHTIDTDADSDQQICNGRYSVADILAWLPVQLCLCCLTRSSPFRTNHDDVEALQNTHSIDTYVTAQSRPSDSWRQTANIRNRSNRRNTIEVRRWMGKIWSTVSPYIPWTEEQEHHASMSQ